MSRMATIEKLKDLEERKEDIEELLKHLTIWYTGGKPVMIVTFDNLDISIGKKFEVNKARLIKFLETELYHLEGKIALLIGEL